MKRKQERRERAQLLRDLQAESKRKNGFQKFQYMSVVADRILKEKREARKAA